LVELMGGTIGVTSVPGRGSIFTFSIVIASDGEEQSSASPLSPGQTVLIACGRPTLRTWLIQVVEHWGGVALPVGDAQMLASVLDGEAPGMALVDGMLPGHGNHPPARMLMERWPGIPLVVMTLPQDGQAPAGTVSISHPVRLERLCRAITDARSGNVSLPPVNTASERLRFSGRVLVVDDHPINRRLANVLLTNLGLEVLEAVDGQQALDVMGRESLVVVLMDCQMPVLDGLESTRRWRANESPNTHLPIIALTANVFSDDRQRCQAAGMDGFLGKPLREEELIQILRTHLPQVSVTSVVQTPAAEPITTTDATATHVSEVIDPRTRAMLEGMPGTVAGTTLFHELTTRFRAEFAERFDQLVADVIGEDPRGTAQKAHALRGSSLTLGMNVLGTVLSEVEQHARNNDLAGAVQLLGSIEAEWRRVTDDLDALTRSSA
jgi:CheY-like chemotaxis protein/HPt (histidine-containing phosphotransfer) domain-containing protein